MEDRNLLENIKKLSEQIKIDDIEENPESAFEQFQCDCCGEVKMMAGSLPYADYRLCNDCVTLAETSFALDETFDIQDLIDSMEDKRFSAVYDSLFTVDENSMN
ncbi:MAG: hypothetical protein A2Y25_10855 [Candidatus Melainabacteria bacterium GWF2_37_15]|nr:MAG: hypothetical protein A2Y25_10855 [Candidatus Melainabacteria bacterium GWF2_37_15]